MPAELEDLGGTSWVPTQGGLGQVLVAQSEQVQTRTDDSGGGSGSTVLLEPGDRFGFQETTPGVAVEVNPHDINPDTTVVDITGGAQFD